VNNIIKLVLVEECRIRVAGGTVEFVHGGKILDNSVLEDSWHTFPENTTFELIARMERTETYLLKVTEEVVTKVDGKTSVRTAEYGVFLRGMSWDKLRDHAEEVHEVPAAEIILETEEIIDSEPVVTESVEEPAAASEVEIILHDEQAA
jgi:hypothetical protein